MGPKISDFRDIIDAICDRLNGAIAPLQIVAWLENFDSNDWKKALIVLNCLEYFSVRDILNELNYGLSEIVKTKNQNQTIYLIPVGKSGKSGAAILYYLKKTLAFKESKAFIISEDENDKNQKEKIVGFNEIGSNSIIVLVDDFSGSGKSIKDFYNLIKTVLPKDHLPIALTVVYFRKAEELLKKSGIRIIGNKRLSAFVKRGSVFGYYPRMKAMREFCFLYGDKLYAHEKYKNGKTPQHPLGYMNTQALVAFDHSVPNNTLSIIWSDTYRKDDNRRWVPLFPRKGELMLARAKEFKETQRYWISIAYRIGLTELFLDKEKYERKSLQLLSMIYLKQKRKSFIYICQTLGINLSEYEKIVEEGFKKELFDKNGELTSQAIEIFNQIRKKARFQRSQTLDSEIVIEEDWLYMPKTFRGSS